ncbi:hypothetical protein CR205_06660 [Alteribacter lacisalsi]|uniref:NQR-1 subunit F n=2 Tax=Alteribacter lacisalsi TaxID=2045244 RepID=A0A2W0H8S4_9BACI|nr:PDR/VanB family oxidoreductase [Alteribacter lacisalsi]PYZ98273.1 hypothetical protein CR205_06660 [Alteribacter lacisalsi]
MNSFYYVNNKRCYLLIVDSTGKKVAAPLLREFNDRNERVKSVFITSAQDWNRVIDILHSQTMGTYLYCSCESGLLEQVEKAAVKAGFQVKRGSLWLPIHSQTFSALTAILFLKQRPDVLYARVLHAVSTSQSQSSALITGRHILGFLKEDREMIKAYINEVIPETASVKRFRIASHEEFLPTPLAGAHLLTAIGHNGKWVRPYSIVRYSAEGWYEIAILHTKSSRGGSAYWHEKVKPGHKVLISLPKNGIMPSVSARYHVFYAAGIGITPMISMAEWCCRKGKPFTIHYTARTREECAFYSFLKRRFGSKNRFYFTKEKSPERLLPCSLKTHPIGTAVYICGPPAFNHQFEESAKKYGYPDHSIYTEPFAVPVKQKNEAFTIQTKREVFTVSKDENLLDQLEKKGYPVVSSCRAGHCGTCEIKIIKGDPVHRDRFLTVEERKQGSFIPCVSRGEGGPLLLKL